MNKIGGNRRRVVTAALVMLALVTSACGGGGDDLLERAVEEAASEQDVDVADIEEAAANLTDDDLAAAFGENARPDWLPVWVVLPEDLDISLEFWDPATGEANVTGWVADGDPEKLFVQAKLEVQIGGYIIGELNESAQALTLNADHTNNGRSVRVGVIPLPNQVQWTMEFSGLTG